MQNDELHNFCFSPGIIIIIIIIAVYVQLYAWKTTFVRYLTMQLFCGYNLGYMQCYFPL
jgi:hypothetical protein